jgi:hypothetical protein
METAQLGYDTSVSRKTPTGKKDKSRSTPQSAQDRVIALVCEVNPLFINMRSAVSSTSPTC